MSKLKKILFFIFCTLLVGFSFAKTSDYLEYADIPGTDVINFNGQVNGVTYEVWIDTGQIDYITGSDGKIHVCFPIIGTGYTNKLGEIYFQYDGYGSYVCDDYKLRGVFKIGAGGWGHMEDLENTPEKWKCFLDKDFIDGYYYHSNGADGTGQTRLDDIGFANWNTVKTELNLYSAFSNIEIIPQFNFSNLVANGVSTGQIILKFLYPNKSDPTNPYTLKNFSFSKISFFTGFNSDVKKNGNLYPGFRYIGPLVTDENGTITGEFVAYHPGKNLEYGIKFEIGTNAIFVTGSIYKQINPPFLPNLIILPKEVSGKKLIGYKNTVRINIISNPKISNLSFSNTQTNLNFGAYQDYFVIVTGDDIGFNQYRDLKIKYNLNKFYSGDALNLNYKYFTDYSFKQGGNLYSITQYSGETTYNSLYKDGLVDDIKIIPDSSNVYADGKQVFWYKVKFLNSQNYPINHLTFNLDFSDPGRYFNLNSGSSYEKGYFLVSGDTNADVNGTYNIGVISYKPVSYDLSAYLTGWIRNIHYNGNYSVNSSDFYKVLNGLYFLNVVSLYLENKAINVNKEININISYTSEASNVSNGDFLLTGYLINCPSCGFKEGKVLSGNNFLSADYTIYITGGADPEKLIYSGFMGYDLAGNYGTKRVWAPFKKTYTNFLFVGGGSLQILGNIVTNKRILGGLSYISTVINPMVFKNRLRKEIYSKIIRGSNKNIVNTNISLDLGSLTKSTYVYKCVSPNVIISLNGKYSGNKKLYFVNCQINIDGNIIKDGKGNLSIIVFASNINNYVDFDSNNGWKVPGNIYIGPSVDTIQANLITDGSILTYSGSFALNADKFFYSSRGSDDMLKKQLFIQGKVFARNTIGGGLQNTTNHYVLLGGQKVPADWEGFDGRSASEIAQAYDIKFWRNSFVNSDGSYDTGDLSQLIYNRYHCTGNTSTDSSKLCSSTIVIMDPNNF